jgi:hypothetical protein
MSLNKAHHKFSHASEGILCATLKQQGIKATGTLSTCNGCARAKAKQKRMNKVSDMKSTYAGQRWYLNTSGPYNETIKGSHYWVKLMDAFSEKCFDQYVKQKSKVPSIC